MNNNTNDTSNDAEQLKGLLKRFPDDIVVSVLRGSALLPDLVADENHIETVKVASAIRKVEIKGKGRWDERKDTPDGGWTRTRKKNNPDPANETHLKITYLDGTIQRHTFKSEAKISYRDGQYFLPNAGTETKPEKE